MPKDSTKQFAALFAVASAISTAISWLYIEFATIRYVDAKYDPVEKRLELIDQRTWEMSGRKDPPPLGMKRAPSGR